MGFAIFWQLALHIIPTPPSRHLTREHTWRDGVDADLDALVRDLRSQHFCQVDCRGLAGIIREVSLRLEHNAGDRRDIDSSAGPSMLLLSCAREKREESTSHEVYLSNVGTVLGVPIVEFLAVRMEQVVAELLCVLACGSELASCVDPGVVDENVEVLLFRFNLLD